ncbi:MAG: hypothetical protein ABSB09_04335 [Acidimicrobiales bacterium]|jgi:hypothetical protein
MLVFCTSAAHGCFGDQLDRPSWRWFQSPAAGYDSAPFLVTVRHGVRVSNLHADAIKEHLS